MEGVAVLGKAEDLKIARAVAFDTDTVFQGFGIQLVRGFFGI